MSLYQLIIIITIINITYEAKLCLECKDIVSEGGKEESGLL